MPQRRKPTPPRCGSVQSVHRRSDVMGAVRSRDGVLWRHRRDRAMPMDVGERAEEVSGRLVGKKWRYEAFGGCHHGGARFFEVCKCKNSRGRNNVRPDLRIGLHFLKAPGCSPIALFV